MAQEEEGEGKVHTDTIGIHQIGKRRKPRFNSSKKKAGDCRATQLDSCPSMRDRETKRQRAKSFGYF